MQATSIAIMPTAANAVDPAGEPASQGQGIRINSAQGNKVRDTLFTSILQQGITLGAAPGLAAGGAAQESAMTDQVPDTTDKKGDDSLDVCGLLMQLMVMNVSPAQVTAGGAEGTDTGEQTDPVADATDVTSDGSLQLSNPAAQGLIEKGGTALEKLMEHAASGNPATRRPEEASGTGKGSVIASIAEAIEKSMIQDAPNGGDTQDPAVPAHGTAAGRTGVMPSAASENALRNTGRTSAEDQIPVEDGTAVMGAAGEPDGTKLTGSGKKSGDSTGSGARERENRDDGTLTGTAAESALTGTARSDGTAAGYPAGKAAAVEKALNRFAEDLKSLRGGAQELKIVLEPESLGVLTISVTKTETGISAKIKSEDRDVVAAISDHLQKLISTIENKGIRLDEVDVVYSQPDQSTGFGQHSFSRGGGETPNNRYAPSFAKSQEADASGGDFWQGYYSEDKNGDATVDYRI